MNKPMNPKYKPFVKDYAAHLITEGYSAFYPDRVARIVKVLDNYCRGLISTDEAMKLFVTIENEGESKFA